MLLKLLAVGLLLTRKTSETMETAIQQPTTAKATWKTFILNHSTDYLNKSKLCTFTGETILTLGIAVLFVLWFPVFYDTSDWRTWLCIIWLTVVAGYVTPKMVKKYLTLFKQLSSVKE